jgi:hypothetical protein
MLRTLAVVTFFTLSVPSLALAQDSGWGVVFSLTPEWKAGSPFEQIFEGESGFDVHGSDFSIGFARGSDEGGDWGVSFIRQSWSNDSFVDDRELDCQFFNGCFTVGEYFLFRDVKYNAFLIHKFAPFVTIANRVQIGMNFGGGIGSFSGMIERRDSEVDFVSFNQQTGRPVGRQRPEVVTLVPPEEELFSPWPIGKVQIAAAVRVAPGAKVRFAGGIDFPGTSSFSVTGVYLFGTQ